MSAVSRVPSMACGPLLKQSLFQINYVMPVTFQSEVLFQYFVTNNEKNASNTNSLYL